MSDHINETLDALERATRKREDMHALLNYSSAQFQTWLWEQAATLAREAVPIQTGIYAPAGGDRQVSFFRTVDERLWALDWRPINSMREEIARMEGEDG